MSPQRTNPESAPARRHRRDFRPRVVVKFRDDVIVPAIASLPTWLLERNESAWHELETWLPELAIAPIFGVGGETAIFDLVARARELDPRYRPPRFENYFRVDIPAGVNAPMVARAFAAFPTVQTAYVEPEPGSPPDVDPTNDPQSASQKYLLAAPESVDATYAWGYEGGDGAGQALVDLEQGWVLEHEDLADHKITIISGTNDSNLDHGAAVLGVIAAVDNDLGCVGITPRLASVRCVSEWSPTGVFDTAAAITSAIGAMKFGDVLLLETQNDITLGTTTYTKVPVELANLVFEEIRLATALGIVVVEAAGNGSDDLDKVVDASGRFVLNRGVTSDFLDSGAILVGAASAAAPHTSLGTSCHGSRIDCYAWGEDVETLDGDGSEVTIDMYQSTFAGTSAASAMIAGVALAVQGLAEANLHHRLGSWQMRALLGAPENGTQLASGESQLLGVMPDLRKIIEGEVLNLAPDVYMRDYVGDVGDPHDGPLSESPDVIVTASPPVDPQASYGAGSGTEDVASLGAEVTAGRDHSVYVRVRNRGGTDVEDVQATVYWAEPSLLLTWADWNEIGSTTIDLVPSGNVLTVSDAIVWPTAEIPASGHYCFVATIGHEKDPEPLPPVDFDTWDNFLAHIRNNNNVTWRNFNIVPYDAAAATSASAAGGVPGDAKLEFAMVGGSDEALWFGLEIVGRLPRGSRALLEIPRSFARQLRASPLLPAPGPAGDLVCVPLNPWGRNRFEEVALTRKTRIAARILVHVPEERRGHAYELFARQTHDGREVGRVAWRLVPPTKPRPPRP